MDSAEGKPVTPSISSASISLGRDVPFREVLMLCYADKKDKKEWKKERNLTKANLKLS